MFARNSSLLRSSLLRLARHSTAGLAVLLPSLTVHAQAPSRPTVRYERVERIERIERVTRPELVERYVEWSDDAWLPTSRVTVSSSKNRTKQVSDEKQKEAALQRAVRLGGTRAIWSGEKQDRVIGLEFRGVHASNSTIASLAPLTDLRILSLSPDQPQRVTDRGLAPLAAMPELEYLGLTGTSVTDAGLEIIRSLPNLRRLELPAATTDAGLAIVAEAKQLEQLRVWPANVSGNGLEALAQLRCLRSLDLTGTALDDESVGALAALECLDLLDLRDTQVTAAALPKLQPRIDADLMYMRGPRLLRKLYLNGDTVLDARQVDDLIRLLGMTEIDTSRTQAEPGKAPRPSETIVPELTQNWLDRAKLEGYREEIAFWKSVGAYIEFADSLVLDPPDAVPAALLEAPMTSGKLQQLVRIFRGQASQNITGLYFIRPRSKDDRPRDDTIFPAGLSNRVLPPRLERLSFRDTEITVSTFLSVIGPAIKAGMPLKAINVFNTATRPTASVEKEEIRPFLGTPGRDRRYHIPFNPGQPGLSVAGIPSRPTLSPAELRGLDDALSQLDKIVLDEQQAELFKAALPKAGAKVVARPRYLPDEPPTCCQNEDGTLKPRYCTPGRAEQ